MAPPAGNGGGHWPVARLTRRAWFQSAGAAAGVTAVGGLLAGCGVSVLPGTAVTHIDLTFAPYPWTGTAAGLLSEGAAAFTATVRGVRLRTVPGMEDAGQAASSILAGVGPDVLWATDYGRLMEAGALLNLEDRVARDHVDLTQWPAGKVAMLRAAHGMFGLPAYTAASCYAVRLQDWDDLKAQRPSPTWTHQDFAAEAQRLTRDSGGSHRYGACIQWYSTGLGDNAWAFRGFGGAQTGADGTSSTLGTPQAVDAGRWIYSLLWARQACTVDLTWRGVGLAPDGVAMTVAGPLTVAGDAITYGAGDGGFQWDYYPFPVFPQGRATYTNTDFFAVSSTTAHADAAWTLLKWVATDASWQRSLMRIGLLPPGSAGLWDQWEAEVRSAVPPLQGKALHWFSDAARGGYAYPQAYYRFDTQNAQGIADTYIALLWNRQITEVQSAFVATDIAINAMLNQAAAQATATAAPPDGTRPRPSEGGVATSAGLGTGTRTTP